MYANKLEKFMAMMLLFGTVLSAALTLSGGFVYLLQHGNEPMHFAALQTSEYPIYFWQQVFLLSSIGIIELGLLMLVGLQLLRVVLLILFYMISKDYIFTLISAFVLMVMIYSLFSPYFF